MAEFKTYVENIAYEVCKFLKTKKSTSKLVKIQIDEFFQDYLISKHHANYSRYKEVYSFIKAHRLKRFFSHNSNTSTIKLTEFLIKLNKRKFVVIKKRKNEFKLKSQIMISIKLRKINFPK